jgi:hypothetical protein
MPDITPNLGIKKPLGNENVSRASFNENFDIIDANAAPRNLAQLVKLTQDSGYVKNVVGVDLNTITDTFACVDSTTSNVPVNGFGFYVITLAESANGKVQIAIMSSTNQRMFFRRFAQSVGWGVWAEISTNVIPTWVAATLQNSWINFGGAESNAGYTKVGSTVRLRGIIKNGTVTAGTTLFTLPSGYRPSISQYAVTLCSGNGIVRLRIDSAGGVTLNSVPSSNAWVQLDNIAFIADGN